MGAAYDGAYYAVGGKRMAFQQDKTKEQDSFILSLPSIAHAMRKEGVSEAEIVLGVGLPIDIYGTQKQAFRDYFLRDDVTFSFEDEPYRCHTTVCMNKRGISFKPSNSRRSGSKNCLRTSLRKTARSGNSNAHYTAA